MRPTDGIYSRFFHYVLRSQPYLAELTRLSKFMPPSQFDIAWDDLRQLQVPIPPLSRQRAIADYLDTETARIDALISKKRRMIELLDERLEAKIDWTATTGDPLRVRHVTSLRTSGPRGWADHVSDHGQPFVRSANLTRKGILMSLDNLVFVSPPDNAEAKRSTTRVGDTLVGLTGANAGWIGAVDEATSGGFVSQHVGILRPDGIAPRWLTYSLKSTQAQEQLSSGQYGGTKTQLGLEDLAEVTIHVPPLNVQHQAVRALDRLHDETERLTGKLKDQIDLLAEHRQALITAAVTGKLDIPGAA